MAPRAKTIKVGTVIPINVTQEWIDESIPCDKGLCMLTLAAIAILDVALGAGTVSNVRSTNHGITFDYSGYRILCVFDHQTGNRIFKYDEIFKKTGSMAKARAAIKPFKAKLMVESCQKAPKFAPMSAETKEKLAARPGRKRLGGKAGLRTSAGRQLSL
jgi:hypothetical protein